MRDLVGCCMSEPFEAQDQLKLRPLKTKSRLEAGITRARKGAEASFGAWWCKDG